MHGDENGFRLNAGKCRSEKEALTWGDAVNTDVVLSPFSGQGLSELDNTSLGSVVARLLLWVVDD